MPEAATPANLEAAFAIPGDLSLPTGGYAYDRRIIDLLPAAGIDITYTPLPRAFPRPSGMDLCTTAQALAALPHTMPLLIDGLAYGAFSAATLAAIPQPVVALVHHPLAFETGIDPERATALLASERAALARANHVVVTSRTTAEIVQADFNLPAGKITVAEPGTDPAPRAKGTGNPLQLLAVGSIVPRKGYSVLIESLRLIGSGDWQLTIAGASRDVAELTKVEAAIAASGLEDRIELAGAVDDAALAELYDRADVFVMSSLFEGYGMVLTEAMARGLPIVCTTGGASGGTVPDSAGFKVAPGDAAALAAAIRAILDDPSKRAALADGAWTAAQDLPRWSSTAATIAQVLRNVVR